MYNEFDTFLFDRLPLKEHPLNIQHTIYSRSLSRITHTI